MQYICPHKEIVLQNALTFNFALLSPARFSEFLVQEDLCCRVEEAMCLRARVSQLREELDTEKRLNAAIKEKKVSYRPLQLRFLFCFVFICFVLLSADCTTLHIVRMLH